MKKKANWIRRILYKSLPLKSYLSVLSQFYFVLFRLGLLKNNESYHYPYFLKNVINKGDICIDIGANLGYLTTLFSRLVGTNGKVYAIEPIKPIFEVLRSNTRNLKNVEILPFALGEENKSIQLGNNTVNKKGFMATGSNFIIDANSKTDVTFDAEMRKGSEIFNKLEKLNFIKCDIEGYEAIVLTELEPVISKHRPILLIETGGDNRKKLIKFFEDRDYKSYILNKDVLSPAPLTGTKDILTVPNERKEVIKKFIG